MSEINLSDAGKVAKAIRCTMDSCIDRDSACAVCDNYEYCYSGGNEQADAADLLDAQAAKIKQQDDELEYGAGAIKTLVNDYAKLEAKLAEVTRERDAAVYDLRMHPNCRTCKHIHSYSNGGGKCKLHISEGCKWVWRGVCAENTEGTDAEPACPSRLDCMGGEGGKVPTDDAMRYAFEKICSVACPSLDDSARITCQTLIAIALGRGLAKDAQLLECARYIAWQIVSEFTDDTAAQDKINDAKTACDVAKAAIRMLKASEDERDISIAELAKADAEGRVRILPEAASGTCGSCAYFRRAKGTRAGTCELRPYRVSKWSPAKYPFCPPQSQKGCKRYQEAARGEHNVDDTDQ